LIAKRQALVLGIYETDANTERNKDEAGRGGEPSQQEKLKKKSLPHLHFS